MLVVSTIDVVIVAVALVTSIIIVVVVAAVISIIIVATVVMVDISSWLFGEQQIFFSFWRFINYW